VICTYFSEFNYVSNSHTVDEVSSSDYSSCSTSNTLSSDTGGTTTITLKTSGTHYYICGISGHCAGGMKLAVTVVNTSSPSTPTSTTTPSTPASGSMSIGSVRELVVIGLGGFVGFVLGVF
jgi:Plastocyanin-like domain